MKQLIEVIKIVADKYMDNVNLIIADNYLTLEYMVETDGEKDVYKTIRIEEFVDKLKIIEIIKKKSKKQEHSKEEVKYIRQKYTQGMNIELIKMYDFQAPPTGTKGTIDFVDDIGTIHIKWENGSSLGLVVGIDEFKVLTDTADKNI